MPTCTFRKRLLALGAAALLPASAVAAPQAYTGIFHSLNDGVAGAKVTGSARLVIDGDALTMIVTAEGLTPGVHLAHVHGTRDNSVYARCATQVHDLNGDGIVDLAETEPTSGITLIPLNGDPASLEIQGAGYPRADATGALSYRSTVSVKALGKALDKRYDIERIDPQRRVVYLHGVAADAKLPESVRSLPGVPARVTLPVACANLVPVPN